MKQVKKKKKHIMICEENVKIKWVCEEVSCTYASTRISISLGEAAP